jgi:hypothetical protein
MILKKGILFLMKKPEERFAAQMLRPVIKARERSERTR